MFINFMFGMFINSFIYNLFLKVSDIVNLKRGTDDVYEPDCLTSKTCVYC